MKYILLSEFESTRSISCKVKVRYPVKTFPEVTYFEAKPLVKGLSNAEVELVQNSLKAKNIMYSNQDEYFEADTQGVTLINILSTTFKYRVSGQSMVIEKTNIGGQTVQTHKTIWTMGMEQ